VDFFSEVIRNFAENWASYQLTPEIFLKLKRVFCFSQQQVLCSRPIHLALCTQVLALCFPYGVGTELL